MKDNAMRMQRAYRAASKARRAVPFGTALTVRPVWFKGAKKPAKLRIEK